MWCGCVAVSAMRADCELSVVGREVGEVIKGGAVSWGVRSTAFELHFAELLPLSLGQLSQEVRGVERLVAYAAALAVVCVPAHLFSAELVCLRADDQPSAVVGPQVQVVQGVERPQPCAPCTSQGLRRWKRPRALGRADRRDTKGRYAGCSCRNEPALLRSADRAEDRAGGSARCCVSLMAKYLHASTSLCADSSVAVYS